MAGRPHFPVLFLACLIGLLPGCRSNPSQQPPPTQAQPVATAPTEPSPTGEETTAPPPAAGNPPTVEAGGTAVDRGGLTLLGTVQSGAQAALSVRQPARIAAVYVQEGDRVRRGQLLVQLDASEFAAQERTAQAGVAAAEAQLSKAQVGRKAQKVKADSDVAAAQSGLRQAQAKLRQAILARDAARDEARADRAAAEEGVRKAQVALERAQENLRGLEELSKVGGVSRSDLEGARAQVTVAQSDLETAQAQVRRLEAGPGNGPSYRVALAQQDVDAAQAGVRQAQEGLQAALRARRQTLALADQDIRAAEAALAQARAGVVGAQATQRTARLVSPLEGVAASVTAHVGETAQPGVPLVTVVSLAGLYVEALVPARQLARLHVGQAARITVEAQPGRIFPTTLSEIARVAEPGGRTFRVRFRFRTANVALRHGQTAHITVLAR